MKVSGIVGLNQKLVAGLEKDFPKRTWELDGQEYKTADLVAAFNAENALIDAVGPAKSAWTNAVTAQRAKTAVNQKLRVALQAVLKQTLGANNAELSDFGFTRSVRKAPTPATAASAVQKRAATRVARHTMGDRQRQSIHGVVATSDAASAAPVVTPPSVPAGDAPTATPVNGALK
jgi:hypothetical protein